MNADSSNGNAANCRRSRFGQRHHVVIEARDLALARLSTRLAIMRASAVDRIGHRPAKRPGVQILLGAGQPQLEIGDPLEAVGDGRLARAKLRRIADDHHITGQSVPFPRDKLLHAFAADLFLTFDQELQLHGQPAGASHPRLGALDVGEHLSFVVGRAAGVEIAVAPVGSNGGEIHSSSGSGGWTS